MKTFQFTATKTIDAENLAEAKAIFEDNYYDFASHAEIEKVDENGNTKLAE